MTGGAPVIVRVTRRFGFPAGKVFDAWLDPTTARRFLFATPGGEMLRAEIDPRVGGGFVFVERRQSGDAEHYGEYLEIDRPRRLVFSFHVDKSSTDLSRVTVEIVPQGGGCELTLTHEIDPKWANYADKTRGGWTMILDGLAATLG